MRHCLVRETNPAGLGWKFADFACLRHELNRIAANYERTVGASAGKTCFVFRSGEPPEPRAVSDVDIKTQTIQIFLKPGPAVVLRQAPAEVGLMLAERVLEHIVGEGQTSPSITLNHQALAFDSTLISGPVNFYQSYSRREKAEEVHAVLENIVDYAIVEMARLKIAVFLLRLHQPVEGQIRESIESADYEKRAAGLSGASIGEDLLLLASLARHQAFAEKAGFQLPAAVCRKKILPVAARNAALMDFAVANQQKYRRYQKYPILTEYQLSEMAATYLMTYSQLLDLYSSAYDALVLG